MPRKKDLEKEFVAALKKNKIGHSGKIFNLGEVNILADYMFGDTIVVFMENVIESQAHKLTSFKKKYSHYEVVLVTENPQDFLQQTWFNEVYDGKEMKSLIAKLKKKNVL